MVVVVNIYFFRDGSGGSIVYLSKGKSYLEIKTYLMVARNV